MGLVIPDGFGEASVLMDFITGPSNPMVCVFGYINDGAQPPGVNAQFINDAWDQFIMGNIHINNNVLHLRTSVRQNPGNGTATVASGAAGPQAGQGLPPNVTYLIRKQTARGGRDGRGRMYLPGPNINSVLEGGVVHPTAISDLTVAMQNFNADLGSVSIEMYLLHSVPITAPDAVTFLSCDSVIATQRRRLRG